MLTYSQIHHSVIKPRRQSNPRKLNVLSLHLFTNQFILKKCHQTMSANAVLFGIERDEENGTWTYSLEVRFRTGSVIDREWKLINLDGGEDLIGNVSIGRDPVKMICKDGHTFWIPTS